MASNNDNILISETSSVDSVCLSIDMSCKDCDIQTMNHNLKKIIKTIELHTGSNGTISYKVVARGWRQKLSCVRKIQRERKVKEIMSLVSLPLRIIRVWNMHHIVLDSNGWHKHGSTRREVNGQGFGDRGGVCIRIILRVVV